MSAAKARARELGVAIAPTVMQVGAQAATFELDRLQLDPDVCVGCGAEPARPRGFVAWQGVELVVMRFLIVRDFAMPACWDCERRRKRWRCRQLSVLLLTPLALNLLVLATSDAPALMTSR